MKKDEDIQSAEPMSTPVNTEERINTNNVVATSAGEILREARNAKGLSIDEVAMQLKLKPSIIEHLETDSLDNNLYTPTFVRGYLCSYAKLLGVQPSKVSDIYDLTHDAKKSADVRMQSFSQSTQIRESDNRVMYVTWGLIVVLIVLSISWWWQNREETVLTDMDTTEIQDIVISETDNIPVLVADDSTETSGLTQLDETQDQDTDAQDQEKSVSVTVTSAQNSDTQEVDVETKTIEEVEQPKSEVIEPKKEVKKVVQQQPDAKQHSGVVEFTGDCWINIRGADGKSLINGVKKAGTSSTFSGQPPFKVVIGAPSNVKLNYDGKPVDLSEYSKNGKVARLTLGK